MALRVTRPGSLEGIHALKASEGVKDYDVNTMATRQEMRQDRRRFGPRKAVSPGMTEGPRKAGDRRRRRSAGRKIATGNSLSA